MSDLRFEPEDEDRFFAARDQLLARFAAAVSDHDARFGAQHALDWKWGYGDGDLGRWTVGQIEEFVIEWCPRKVSMPAEDARSLCESLSRFLGFLHDEALLSGSDPRRHDGPPRRHGRPGCGGDGGPSSVWDGQVTRFGDGQFLLTGAASASRAPTHSGAGRIATLRVQPGSVGVQGDRLQSDRRPAVGRLDL